jgi:hypothetical protein
MVDKAILAQVFTEYFGFLIQKTENTAVEIRCADHETLSTSKSWH